MPATSALKSFIPSIPQIPCAGLNIPTKCGRSEERVLRCGHVKGRYTYDVRKIFGFFTPPEINELKIRKIGILLHPLCEGSLAFSAQREF